MLFQRNLSQLVVILLGFLWSARPVRAESALYSVTGRVLDQSARAVGGARVRLLVAGRPAVETHSEASGEFRISTDSHLAGNVQLAVQAEGFQVSQREVRLGETESQHFEIVLAVEGSILSITVTEMAGYRTKATTSATKTPTALLDIPQSISVINSEQMRDQMMMSMADVVRYVPGITMAQGEGHRDAPVIRGNASTADFFINGVRDDVQYFRDLYNLERVEALKGPNAMIFGRGGGGGVLNRVSKEASFTPIRALNLQGGSFGNRRVSADFDQPLNRFAALRLNTMFEDSNSFRRYGNVNRYGVSPTLTLLVSPETKVRVGYEFFRDGRVVDRGIPSFGGLPLETDRRLFFGNPDQSRSRANVHLGNVVVERQLGLWNLKNQTLFGSYDKFYGNVFPGAVNAARTMVSLSAYDTATQRQNFFNQTDLVRNLRTAGVRHTLLAGVELGRQVTDNLRNTGYLNGNATTRLVPLAQPTDFASFVFRQSATDANNHVRNHVSAAYMQDQLELTPWLQMVAGLRLDHFDLRHRNNRSGENLRRIDNMLSPRLGIVLKPQQSLSVYGNYSVSFLPSAGDQFAALSATNQSLKPEKFTNFEIGTKYDLNRGLSLTAALYRLDRTNTTAIDPNNPAILVQTGSQRSNGLELALNGQLTRAWTISAGAAWQDAYISSTTAAARQGARVPQVPGQTLSIWNHYRLLPRLGVGLGLIQQASMYAAIDNAVKIPAFARADAALFYEWSERIRLQANVENLTDRNYILNGHNNNNLTPGSARALRVGMSFRF